MTRYEEHEPVDRDQLKKEIRREIKRDEKKQRLVVGLIVLVIFFALLATPFLVLGVVVAKSGVRHVPILSEWFFKPVAPTKIVVPLLGSGPDAVLAAAIARINYNESIGSFTMYLTEQELTTVLNSSISGQESGALPFSPLRRFWGRGQSRFTR